VTFTSPRPLYTRGKKSSVPFDWAPEPVWRRWRRENSYPLLYPRRKSRPGCAACSLGTILTELPQMLLFLNLQLGGVDLFTMTPRDIKSSPLNYNIYNDLIVRLLPYIELNDQLSGDMDCATKYSMALSTNYFQLN
jgi:hypothetical protein